MSPLTSFRRLAVVIGICVSAIAQAPPAAPSGSHDASPIPLAEAEAHLLQHEALAYPPLAKAARIEGTVHLVLRVDPHGVVAGVVVARVIVAHVTETPATARHGRTPRHESAEA